MDALTGAIVRLLQRVELLETRLARLEQGAGIPAPPPAAPIVPERPPATTVVTPLHHPPQLPAMPQEPAPPRPPDPPPPAPPAEEASAPAPSEGLETKVGLAWVNRIGALTLMLGVAFFFKYAVDNEWIGESGRVILGVLAGCATLFAADVLWQRAQRTFANGLTGLGIGILYLSFYAAFGFYKLVPQQASFVLMAVTSVTAGALAIRYNASAIGILGLLAGYATPLLLSTGEDRPWVFFSYILLLDLGALWAARRQNWRAVELLSAIATAFLYLAWFAERFRSEKQLVAAVFAVVFYLVYVLSRMRFITVTAQLLGAIALAAIFDDHTGPFFATALAVAAAGLVVADRRLRPELPAAALSGFWLSYFAWADWSAGVAPLPVFAHLTIAFLLFAAWPLFWSLFRGRAPRYQDLTVMAANSALYYGASFARLDAEYHAYLGLLAVAVAALNLFTALALWKRIGDKRPSLLGAGLALAFLTLAIPVQLSAYRITVAWAIEAAALAWIALRTGERKVYFGSWAVFALVLLRLFSIDMDYAGNRSTTPLVFEAFFLTFVVAAVSYWLGAWWSRATPPAAAALYFLGHLVMLTALGREVLIWAVQNVAPENLRSVEAMGITILMALYALVLIGLGVWREFPFDRLLGLGLIALAVLKLYLSDVWDMGRLFRMLAFLGLGVLLLGASYLYSRYRSHLEKLWKR